MPTLLIVLLLALFSASPVFAGAQETLDQWQYVQDPDSSATFAEINDFITQHPQWPDQKRIRVRAERMMRAANLDNAYIIAWFSTNPPISGVGKWSYAEALHRQQSGSDIDALVKEAWKDADVTEDEEENFLTMFGTKISTQDNIARVNRLLWEGKISPARRLIPKLPVAQQVLAQARIALQQDARNANFLVGQVNSTLKEDDGLQYDRMQYRSRKKDKNGVRDILTHAPKIVSYPERWWKIRELEIRRAIDEKNYRMASKLLVNHGQSDGAPLADALWLDGWLKLEFLNKTQEAYKTFYHMYDAVRTPVSKARAAYWMGRAAKKSGDTNTANEWFSAAAKNPTAFYGQLAASELSDSPSLSLPDEPALSLFTSDPVLSEDMEEAIRICIKNGDDKLATKLINAVIENAESEHSVLTVAALGHALSAPHISVKAAKKAQQKGVVLKNIGYPRPETDSGLPIERPLTLAITRQESEFDPLAESRSGAIGMMQLLPGTAHETAKKIGVPYKKADLIMPEYNMKLGSHYLSRMINSYSGSYVMAIASYNAGPGNVRKWIQQFGTPGNDPESAVNWIEKIPFSETRNYVMRVMENLQVYRALEGADKLAIKEDLVR
jgi:soluble lytic murein transglycosylase